MFFHFLSFSIIFFDFRCLCWVLKICFFGGGLNFVTISLYSSYVKNQFLGPSRVVPSGPSFPFFPTFFWLPFYVFFLAFYFLIFLFFCSFLHFLVFLMFFIFFFHFFRRKRFFFSFLFVYLSIFFFLLALVSEFNCFLRSRCPMEMWCPDDIARDSWDWVGPPAWGRECFNFPEWSGGSSLVKTEPPQIVLLLLLHGKIIIKRIFIVRFADLSDFFFSLIFVGKMRVFVSRPMKIVTFLRKTLTTKNGLFIFLGKETHSETKSWKSSKILTKKITTTTTTTVNLGNR